MNMAGPLKESRSVFDCHIPKREAGRRNKVERGVGIMENKQTNQPSEIQGTKTHRQEYYKRFGDHDGVLSKLSFRSKQQNVF